MPKLTDKLVKNWSGVEFESSTVKTQQFKLFAKDFKNAIKEQTSEDFDIIGYNVGHFYVSGFLKNKENPDKFVYFSIPDVRGFREEWRNDILIRTAQHEKDFTGGNNNYTSLHSFGENAKRLVG